MFKNYCSTFKAIFLSYTALYFFDVAAASAVRWLHLQNTPARRPLVYLKNLRFSVRKTKFKHALIYFMVHNVNAETMKPFLLSFLLATCLTGCGFIESLKPKETFFCRVNGEKFRPEKDDSPIGGIGSDPLRVTLDRKYNWLYIQARKSLQYISIVIKLDQDSAIKVNEYTLVNEITKTHASYFVDYTAHPSVLEELISINGVVRVTKIDGYNLSGTFEFTCKSAKNGKEYKITKGEFNDISYY
jgi:hypothetical protein